MVHVASLLGAVDRKWFRMSRCTRKYPVWVSSDARPPPPQVPAAIESGRRKRMRRSLSEPTLVASPAKDSKEAGSLADALVMVSFDIPYLVDGISGGEYVGTGIVFDKENGKGKGIVRMAELSFSDLRIHGWLLVHVSCGRFGIGGSFDSAHRAG